MARQTDAGGLCGGNIPMLKQSFSGQTISPIEAVALAVAQPIIVRLYLRKLRSFDRRHEPAIDGNAYRNIGKCESGGRDMASGVRQPCLQNTHLHNPRLPRGLD